MPETIEPIPNWSGFYDPNYTPIPDNLFDVVMPHLTDVELRVLLYIMRRTYGFKKRSDEISLSQITEGITKQNGERLDYGAGVSERGAQIAVKRLEERGVIEIRRNRGDDGRLLASTYSLRRAGTPTAPNAEGYRTKNGRATAQDAETLPHQMPRQETVVQDNSKQEDTVSPEPSESDAPPVRFSPYIAAVITDYAREFGELANVAASVDRACVLWQQSGLSEAAFVERLQQARVAAGRGARRTMRALFAGLQQAVE